MGEQEMKFQLGVTDTDAKCPIGEKAAGRSWRSAPRGRRSALDRSGRTSGLHAFSLN
ncbi:hypothetical protein ACFL2T_01795 [Elusimicrobiota bacterium]